MRVHVQPVSSLLNEFNELFATQPMFHSTERQYPIGVKESDDTIHVTAMIPGVERENVKVTLHDQVLTISGERKRPEIQKGEQWIRNEIAYGTYEQTIQIPYAVDAQKITATQENGVLRVALPKAEEAKPKHITIS